MHGDETNSVSFVPPVLDCLPCIAQGGFTFIGILCPYARGNLMDQSGFAQDCMSLCDQFIESANDNQTLQKLIDANGDSVYIKDSAGQILYANSAYDEMFARGANPIGRTGQNFLDQTVKSVSSLSDGLILSGAEWLEFAHFGADVSGQMLKFVTFKRRLPGTGNPSLSMFCVSRSLGPEDSQAATRFLTLAESWRIFQKLPLRDQEIAGSFARGAIIAETAEEFGVGNRTIENRRQAILEALALSRTHELVVLLCRLQEHGFRDFGI